MPKLGWFSHPDSKLINQYLDKMHNEDSTPEEVKAAGESLKSTIKGFSTIYDYNTRIDNHVNNINQDKFNWRVDTHMDSFKNTPEGLLDTLLSRNVQNPEDLHRFHND